MRFGFVAIIVLASAASAATVDLPLRAYYRVGRFMPVRVSAGACQRLWIEGDGVLPIVVEPGGKPVDAIFPLLVVSPPNALTVRDDQGNSQTFPLQTQELGVDQRLIGTVGDAGDAPRRLFADKASILVPLDPNQPITGGTVAWEALDAVVSDGRLPGRNDEIDRTLLGSGVVFAAKSEVAPDQTWPWKKDGPWQVLRRQMVGPHSALAGDSAYLPARGWTPGVQRGERVIVLAAGVITAILMLAATLVRQRWSWVAVCVVAMACTVSIAAAAKRHSPARRVDTGVLIVDGPLVQYDIWQYQTTPLAADVSMDWARPMLTSPAQVARQQLTLECFPTGRPVGVRARLERNEVLATMSKFVYVMKLQMPTDGATDSPTHAIVRDAYLRPGMRVVGQSTLDRDNEAIWPAVVLEVAKP